MRPSCATASPRSGDVRPALLRDPWAETDECGVRRDLAGDERLAHPERGRLGEERRRRKRERVSDVAKVTDGRHAHEHEVVALGDDELVDAVRTLGRDEEVEAELAALGLDAGGVLGRESGDLVAGLAADTRCAPRR